MVPWRKEEESMDVKQEALFLRVAGTVQNSFVDGPGIRFVLFTQGCFHDCPGCHNKDTQDPLGGTFMSLEAVLRAYEESYADGITLSGGEPLLQPKVLAEVAKGVQERGGDVIVYTGFLLVDVLRKRRENPFLRSLLSHTDLLIEGPYVEAQRSLQLPFRGSSNQRLVAFSPKGEALKKSIEILEASALERL